MFWTNLSKFQAFYEILNFNLAILTIFLRKIWPLFGLFSFFRIWPLLKLHMAKFGLLNFFWTWQLWHKQILSRWERERERIFYCFSDQPKNGRNKFSWNIFTGAKKRKKNSLSRVQKSFLSKRGKKGLWK